MTIRAVGLTAIAAVAIGCVPAPTEARPPLVSEAGSYAATVRYPLMGTRLQGAAEIDTAANGSTVVRLHTTERGGTVTIEFFSGLNGTGNFDFSVGEHSLVGVAGVQALNAIVTVSNPGARTYHAGTGYLEIVESTPAGIVARFEFNAASVYPKEYVAVRGSFSAVPAAH